MNITIIGTGYVGLVTGTCFAEMGNNVTCVDIDKRKIEDLRKGILPIYEPGLDTMVLENQKKGTLKFATSINSPLKEVDVCFIAVGTPMKEDGSADLQHVIEAAIEIGKKIENYLVIVDKSTVPVGTADKVKQIVQRELAERQKSIGFDVVSNPEFLKEGAAIEDFMHPDRVIVGAENQKSIDVLSELYNPFMTKNNRLIVMDICSAEMTKYAANAMLATKISFMNEIANICERVGADVNHVRHGIGSDSRIGYSFIYPGCGYGGSCFPKDVQALIKTANDCNYTPRILEAIEAVNYDQKKVVVEKVKNRFGKDLNGLAFAVWGLSFKPETDDMREATSITVIKELTSRGAKIKAYDPKAMDQARNFYLKDNPSIEYNESKYSVLNRSDSLILLTEWKEFRSPDFDEIKKRLNNPIIFDGRNQYSKEKMKRLGFEYFQIGVK